DNGSTAADFESLRRAVHRWEKEGTVSVPNRLLYSQAFGIDISQFGPRPDGQPPELAMLVPALRDAADPLLSAAPVIIYRERQGEFAVGQELAMAGHESSGHAAEREPYDIGETTFEQLRAYVVRLSRQTNTGAPLPAFRDLRRVRDQIHLLLDRRLLLR